MTSLPLLLLLLLVSGLAAAGLSSPGPEAYGTKGVRGASDVSSGALLTLFQQLHGELTTYKEKVNSLSSQLHTAEHRMDAELQARQDKMDTELQAMQRKVDVASKSVAFTARISPALDNGNTGMSLGHHQTVVFDNVVTNIGNAYNPHTGIFTAPVDGTYVFFLQLMSVNNYPAIYMAMVKNGAILDVVFAEGLSDSYDQGSSQVTTHLTVGDHVWVRQNGGTRVRADWWTVFTGFLLHAD